MVYNVNNIIYGLFRLGTYRLIEKIRCMQINRLWSRSTPAVTNMAGKKSREETSALNNFMEQF